MNYREVKCSDRLPKVRGDFEYSNPVLMYDSSGYPYKAIYDYGKSLWINESDGEHICEHGWIWLEPYELPTEEEITKIIHKQLRVRGFIVSTMDCDEISTLIKDKYLNSAQI